MKVITIDGTKYVPESDYLKAKMQSKATGKSEVFEIGAEVFCDEKPD